MAPTRLMASILLTGLVVTSLAAGPVSSLPEPAEGNVLVLAPGWRGEVVTTGDPFTSSVGFRDGKLLMLDAGRYHYAEPYAGQDAGSLKELTLDASHRVTSTRTIATGLADPIGLTVSPNGDVLFTQYGRVSVIPSAAFDAPGAVPLTHSWGYPAQTTDFVFLPVTGTYTAGPLGETAGLEPDTTGPMGLAVRAGDGQVFVSQSLHGTPPDDAPLRTVTGLDYDNPYSSAIIAPAGGALTPDQVAARACRNCYDLAFAPEGSDWEGELFVTENVGPYRARLAAGSGRTLVEGSTATDQNLLDGVNHVDLATGQVKRVATFRPDSGIAGITPTGIAFAPVTTPDYAGEMFVTLMSGFVPETNDRGELVVVRPDVDTPLGAGTHEVIAHGLDSPIDVAFAPDGSAFVVEFYTGTVWRFSAE